MAFTQGGGETVGTAVVDVTVNIKPLNDGFAEARKRAERFTTDTQQGMTTLTGATNLVAQALAKFNIQGNIAERAVQGLSNAMGAFNQITTRSLGILPGLVGVGGFAGIVFAAHQAVQAFAAWEQRQISFEGRLRATRGLLGTTSDEIMDLARTINRETNVPIESLQNVALEMGRTGVITGANLQRAMQLLPDLTARVGDFATASQVLTKALKDPSEAIKLLREAGIEFSDSQRKLLNDTDNLSDVMDRQRIILEEVARQAGGEGATQGAAGSFNRLGQAVADFTVRLGQWIDKWLQFSAGARGTAQAIEGAAQFLFPQGTEEQVAAIRREVEALRKEMELLQQGARGFNLGDFMSQLGSIAGVARPDQRGLAERLKSREEDLIEAERLRAFQNATAAVEGFNRARERQRGLTKDVITDLENELKALDARNRAEMRAVTLLRQRVPAFDEESAEGKEAIRKATALARAIEDRRRAIAQADQLSIFERENMRLEQQVQLFRHGNQEMAIRGRLLQIQLAAAARRQPLTAEQSETLLKQMRLLQEVQRLTSVVDAAFSSLFNSMGDALAEFAATGEFNMKQFADGVIRQLVRIATQAFVIQPLLNMISGFTNSAIAGLVSPGSTTSPIKIPTAGKYQHGGSFSVPTGQGAGDRPYLIGLSAGERVDVTPASGAGGGGGAVTVVNNINSSKDFEVTTRESRDDSGRRIIEQTFNEVVRRIGRGDADGTFGARYGMRPRTAQR